MKGSDSELTALSSRRIADAQAVTRMLSGVPYPVRLKYQNVLLAVKTFASTQCFADFRAAKSDFDRCLELFERTVAASGEESASSQSRVLLEKAREIGDAVLCRYDSVRSMQPIVELSLAHPAEPCMLDSKSLIQVELSCRILIAENVAPPPKTLSVEVVGRHGRGGTIQLENATGTANEFYASMRVDAKIGQTDWERGSVDLAVKWNVVCEPVSASGESEFVVPFACPTTTEDIGLYGECEAEGARFVGRKTTLEQIMAGIRSGSGYGVLVSGQRKTGKSSLLKKIEALSADGFCCLRGTMYGMPRRDESDVEIPPQVRILECFEKTMEGGNADLARRKASGLSLDSRWERVKAWKNAGKRLVLMIDEFQEIYHNYRDIDSLGREAVDKVVEKLRVLVTECGINVIIAAQDSFQNFTEAANVLAPFTKVRTSYLSESDLGELVGLMSMGGGEFRRVDAAGVHRIYGLTGGNPYFTQIFCGRLVCDMRKSGGVKPFACEEVLTNVERKLVDPDEYESVLRPDAFESFFGLGLYDRSGNLFKDAELLKLYCHLATGQDVGKHKALLSRLRERFIVDSRNNCNMPLFMRWLVRQPIDELAPELFCRREE